MIALHQNLQPNARRFERKPDGDSQDAAAVASTFEVSAMVTHAASTRFFSSGSKNLIVLATYAASYHELEKSPRHRRDWVAIQSESRGSRCFVQRSAIVSLDVTLEAYRGANRLRVQPHLLYLVLISQARETHTQPTWVQGISANLEDSSTSHRTLRRLKQASATGVACSPTTPGSMITRLQLKTSRSYDLYHKLQKALVLVEHSNRTHSGRTIQRMQRGCTNLLRQIVQETLSCSLCWLTPATRQETFLLDICSSFRCCFALAGPEVRRVLEQQRLPSRFNQGDFPGYTVLADRSFAADCERRCILSTHKANAPVLRNVKKSQTNVWRQNSTIRANHI